LRHSQRNTRRPLMSIPVGWNAQIAAIDRRRGQRAKSTQSHRRNAPRCRPPAGLRCRLRSGDDIQRPNQILQCVAATVIPMAKGISEADDHSDSNCPDEQTCLRLLSDGRSRHSGSGKRSHWRWHPASSRFQSTSDFESRIVSAYASGSGRWRDRRETLAGRQSAPVEKAGGFIAAPP
jgi:hypothetical protein